MTMVLLASAAAVGAIQLDRSPVGTAQDSDASNADIRDVAVVAGRIDRIDPFGRSLVLQTADGVPVSVFVGRGLKVFDELRVGDSVTVRTTESVVVVPRPGAKTTAVEDQTTAANRGAPGTRADVIQRLRAIVIIENVDEAGQTIAYKGADNRSVTRQVANRRLLDGLKRGDIVEITYSRERTIQKTMPNPNSGPFSDCFTTSVRWNDPMVTSATVSLK